MAAADLSATSSVATAHGLACEGWLDCLFDWQFWTSGGITNTSEVIRNIGIIAGVVIGGGVGFWFALVRTRAARRQSLAAMGGHITDRYSKAVEQLGHRDSLHVRLGGIYALGHLGRDNPRYRDTVIDVLCAFIRTQKPEGIGRDNEWVKKESADAGEGDTKVKEAKATPHKSMEREYPPAPPDVRAALDQVVELNPEARRRKWRRSRSFRGGSVLRDSLAAWLRWIGWVFTPPVSPSSPS
ncbi:MAG: hypothetical protein EXQ98_02055 [Alphaproteobacteria bacterium]|nr:hypothetical protein [Alphaproteobacteria bacterium]